MSGSLMVVAAFQNRVVEKIISGDIDMTFVGENACLNLPVGETGAEQEGNILMHGLECLEDKEDHQQRLIEYNERG